MQVLDAFMPNAASLADRSTCTWQYFAYRWK